MASILFKEYTIADNIFHKEKFMVKISTLNRARFQVEDNLQLNIMHIL